MHYIRGLDKLHYDMEGDKKSKRQSYRKLTFEKWLSLVSEYS